MIDNGFGAKRKIVPESSGDGTGIVATLLPFGIFVAVTANPVAGGVIATGGAIYIGSTVYGLVRKIRENRRARKNDDASSGPLH